MSKAVIEITHENNSLDIVVKNESGETNNTAFAAALKMNQIFMYYLAEKQGTQEESEEEDEEVQ